jgi:S-ribosylhomocysteine lyase LuxS involved in autoinducer biosynthesis
MSDYLNTAFMKKRVRIARQMSPMGERKGAYRTLVGKPEGRRPLGRLSRRWEYNIKTDLREVGWGYGLDQSGSG